MKKKVVLTPSYWLIDSFQESGIYYLMMVYFLVVMPLFSGILPLEMRIKRSTLKTILDKDKDLSQKDTDLLAEKIFVVIEGAYYYLSMIEEPKEYQRKLDIFKNQVLELIQMKQGVKHQEK